MKNRTLRHIILITLIVICGWFFINDCWAAEKSYPTRSIDIIAGFGAGGPSDLLNRALAKGLEKHLQVTLVPVNKPGGSGLIAMSYLANSPPDGYTMVTQGMNLLIAVLNKTATSSLEDFMIVGQASAFSSVMAVSANAPWKTFQEFVDYAKKNPGTKYAHPGTGSIIYNRMENLNKAAELGLIGVPFKSDAECIAPVMSMNIPIGVYAVTNPKRQADAGKMRILFSFDPPKEAGLDPNLPTINSFFGKTIADLDIDIPMFLWVPAKTPPEIVKILETALKKVCDDPEFAESLKKIDLRVAFLDSETCMKQKLPHQLSRMKTLIEAASQQKK